MAHCEECTTARVKAGNHRWFDQACMYCCARLLQQIPKSCGTNAEASQRRKAALDVWVAQGHSEAEISELVALTTLAYEPVKR